MHGCMIHACMDRSNHGAYEYSVGVSPDIIEAVD